MGMFNIGDNKLFRDILNDYPDEKQLPSSNPATASTQATVQKLQVLRTYVDGSAAATQRAVPDLLAPLGSAAFALPEKIQVPADGSIVPNPPSLGEVASQTVQDTLIAKSQALSAAMKDDASGMAEADSANDFKQALMLVQDVTSAKVSVDAKYNVALALKPLLKSFRDTYANDLKVLTDEIPAAKIADLQKAKLGDFKGLSNKEVQYIEKFQRLQVADEQLSTIEALITAGTKNS